MTLVRYKKTLEVIVEDNYYKIVLFTLILRCCISLKKNFLFKKIVIIPIKYIKILYKLNVKIHISRCMFKSYLITQSNFKNEKFDTKR